MKRLIVIASIAVVVALFGQKAMSQNLKFGHINRNELIQSLPEFDSANVQLQNFQKELVNALELMSVELNNKNDAYTKESKNYTDIVKQTKEQELMDMNRRIQEFQTSAQEQLQNKQMELFQPITAKVDKTIQDVGKENGLVYVFDVSGGQVLYVDEAKSTNILTLAKTKLGVKK